ncbi:MAG: hypothetical protein Q7T71_01490, partial [Herbiconiux sp.]|nr:hypothetical protein [Herbiconiux sp.]
VFLGSSLFGFSDAVGLGRPETFRALLFILAVIFVIVGALRFWRGAHRSGIAPLVLGVVLLLIFLFVPLPTQLATAAPYLVTLAVLVVAGTTMRPPAALGQLFPRKNSRG